MKPLKTETPNNRLQFEFLKLKHHGLGYDEKSDSPCYFIAGDLPLETHDI